MGHPLNSEKFPLNSIIELRILSKNSKKSLRSRRNIGKGVKILEIFEINDCNLLTNAG